MQSSFENDSYGLFFGSNSSTYSSINQSSENVCLVKRLQQALKLDNLSAHLVGSRLTAFQGRYIASGSAAARGQLGVVADD